MNIIFYRYGSICEPDIIISFKKLNIEITEINEEITNKNITQAEQIDLVSEAIRKNKPVFVFTVNYFPAIAEICHIYGILYLCWTVDCPVLELFSTTIEYNTNRIFLFDYAQYEKYSKFNPGCIFYLPLASAVERFENVIKSVTISDTEKYTSDISFVGSLYSEKNPVNQLNCLSDYSRGYIEGLTKSAISIYGSNFIEASLNNKVIAEIKSQASNFFHLENAICDYDAFVVAHYYMGYHIAEKERLLTLNELAKAFNIDLYTRSDTTPLQNVHIKGGVQTLTEMPKVFNLSKINLNITMKAIQTGLPLRLFDIMGCKGFVMTNYQAELTEYFEIGSDLEAYASMEELLDKCSYYLEHDEIRRKIALNGYQKIKSYHTYENRIADMIKAALS